MCVCVCVPSSITVSPFAFELEADEEGFFFFTLVQSSEVRPLVLDPYMDFRYAAFAAAAIARY